ncbi:MAG: NAD(P)/FAD-dependent oxidoreductase [Actinomycetota bacterium]|nr:NAD(P)/FAD-dependent oxidoreductase [Actinomycetota bacterium]MDD5668047.1 NAD(P)/FAD-dependent oxidoreductase [Actinomycetota bacterium]
MNPKKYRVIIVGGGPAGSMTAMSLLQLRPGLAGDILVLESKSFPREKVCGGGVSGRVTSFLEELGIPLEGLPRVPVKRFSVHFDEEICSPEFGNDRCFVTRRADFDALLLAEAARRGAEVRTSTPAVGAYRERKGVAVVDRDGVVYHADVFVGADGVNGRSRTWFNLPHRGRKTLLLQTEFPRDPGYPPLRDSLMMDFSIPRFGIPGYAWFFPSLGEGGEPVVNAGISGGAFSGGSYSRLKEAFLAILANHPEIEAMVPSDVHFKPYPEREYTPIQIGARERVLFVGEQLGTDPFTGEGLSVCADSARAAALEIDEALRAEEFAFKGYSRRIRAARFFPLYVVGKTYCLQNDGVQPNFFFAMSTRKKSGGKRNVVDYYTSTFSGNEDSTVLYSPTFWGMVMRDIAVTLPGWVRLVGGKAP